MESSYRPSSELLILAGLWLVGNFAAAMTAVAISGAVGWDLAAIAGDGADVGRASIQVASGAPVSSDVVPIWGTALFQIPFWVALLTAPTVVAGGWRPMLERYRVWYRPRDIPLGLGAGLLTQLLLVPALYLLLFSIFGDADVGGPARALAARAQGPVGVLVFFAIVAIAAPIAEEVAFRGLLLKTLERLMAPGLALLISSVIFAAVHFQLLQFPGLLLFGLVAGVLAQRTRGLMAPIAAHMAFNAVAAVTVVMA
ncbi:MAG: CPBP family intramembrane glutamic endopeptidase [Acidimicrobiales bacterium]